MSSSSKELSKFEKEKQKLIQDKCQGMLNEMLRDDDNKYCVDCDAKGPRWASWNLGIFLCIRCAGIHRNLGVHISRVKSVNLDSWTPEQVVTMQQMGNSRARAVYEANLPDNFRRPQTDVALENFIRAKYEHTKYIAQEWVKPPPPRVDWNAEVEEQIRKKKEKKTTTSEASTFPRLGSSSSKSVSNTSPSISNKTSKVPPPVIGKIEVSKPPPAPAAGESSLTAQPVTSATTSSASDDLLGLSTGSSQPLVDPFASPVKSTNNSATSAEEDLGGVFATSGDLSSQQKMTKESILSLYGNLGSAPAAGFGGGAGIAANNPFAAATAQPYGANPISNNPFPGAQMQQQPPQQQQGLFGNDLVGNGFAGGGGMMMMGGNTNATSQQQMMLGNSVSQLQQGVFSLNLGNPNPGAIPPALQQQQQPISNSNNLLFNNASVSPASTNLNAMVMNSTTSASNTSAGGIGYFGAAVPNSMIPPASSASQQQQMHMMQMQQQNHLFNQFQSASVPGVPSGGNPSFGLFQNGGSPAAAGNNTISNNPVNVDLLWK